MAEQLAFFDTSSRLPPPVRATPLVKWAGGKTWAIDLLGRGIWRYLCASGGRYIEPFLGGGSMALWLGIPDMILNDAAAPLMEMYEQVTKDPDAVAWALSAMAVKGVDEKTYYEVRDRRPHSPVQRAARFIYLNKLCFNGIYRVNKSGKFNVPYAKDKYRRSMVSRGGRDAIGSLFPNKDKFKRVAKAFRFAELFHCDFAKITSLAGDGDLVYADPPYDGVYASYTSKGFDEDDQRRLAEELREAHQHGAHVVAHNSATDLIRELYEDWAYLVPSAEGRSVNSDVRGRGRVKCYVITTKMELLGT